MQEEIDATYIEIIEHEYDKVDPSSKDTDHLTERRDIEVMPCALMISS